MFNNLFDQNIITVDRFDVKLTYLLHALVLFIYCLFTNTSHKNDRIIQITHVHTLVSDVVISNFIVAICINKIKFRHAQFSHWGMQSNHR